VGSSLHIEGHPAPHGRVQDKITTLVKLSASEANILQHVAFETVQQLQKAGGYLMAQVNGQTQKKEIVVELHSYPASK
jgi:hypothetical protein